MNLVMFFVVLVAMLTIYFHVRYNEKTLAYAPTILTTTGIFATFLGIALSLLDFDPDAVGKSVLALLGGLKVAFWASVFGVGGALTITFRHYFFEIQEKVDGVSSDGEVTAQEIVLSLKSIQKALIGSEEATLVSQLKLLRQDNNDRLDSLKLAQQESLQKLTEMSSKTLVEALRDVIKDFNHKITEQFGDNFKQLNEAVGQLLAWQEQYKAQIETVVERHNTIANTMQVASDGFSSLVNKAETFSKVSSDLSGLLTSLEAQKKSLMNMLSSLGQLLVSASGSLPKIESKILDLTQQLTRSVDSNQKEVNRALVENAELLKASAQFVEQDIQKTHASLSNSIDGLASQATQQSAALAKSLSQSLLSNQEQVSHALVENANLLKASAQQVGQSMESVATNANQQAINMANSLSQAIASSHKEINKLMTENSQLTKSTISEVGRELHSMNQDFNKHIGELADKTNKQVTILDAALTEELKKSLESLGRQLAALSEKFVKDYTPLTDRLREVVNLSRKI